jgi:TRAP-type C4-dicarboxylate transport system permease small subunit
VLDRILSALRRISMLFLVIMMLVTIIDVSMRTLLNELVLGSVELVQFALVAVVFLALPETLSRDEQITVDVIDQFVGAAWVRRLRQIAAIIGAVLLAIMVWRTLLPALDTLEYGDLTNDLQISFFWYWLPIVIGVLAAAIAAVVHALEVFHGRVVGGSARRRGDSAVNAPTSGDRRQ